MAKKNNNQTKSKDAQPVVEEGVVEDNPSVLDDTVGEGEALEEKSIESNDESTEADSEEPFVDVADTTDTTDAADPEESDAGDVDDEDEIERLSNELVEQKEFALRAQAEMQNVRRRSENEVSNARRYALESFLKDFIGLLDSFDGALKTEVESDWPESAKSMHGGIEGIAKQFDDMFKRFNIIVDAPQQGEKFDPQIHEAVTMVAVPGIGKGQVVETVRTGYRLSDRVIRPAMVIVSTGE